jgi:hypothetical protein
MYGCHVDQRVERAECLCRTRRDPAAVRFGCHKPAYSGEYLVLDAFAMILASMLNCFCGLTLKETANNHGGDDG